MTRGIFVNTVTIYHFDGALWQRRLIAGVFWQQKRALHVQKDGARGTGCALRVTVPAEAAEGAPAQVGDVLLCGEGPLVSSDAEMTALCAAQPTLCTVKAVWDNTHRPRLKHWRIEAE